MPLKKNEIEKYKQMLIEMRNHLSKALRGSAEEVKQGDESTGYSQHQADEGTDDFDRTINLELTTNEYETLKQIERALEKIEEGTYGVCDFTNEEIAKARLDAMPYATMTVKAQDMLEKGLL